MSTLTGGRVHFNLASIIFHVISCLKSSIVEFSSNDGQLICWGRRPYHNFSYFLYCDYNVVLTLTHCLIIEEIIPTEGI